VAGGQKRWRKRSLEGLIAVNGVRLLWRLLSEPQQTREHGYKGLCISVIPEGGRNRELILEYPMPDKHTGNGAPQLPERPKFSVKTIEDAVRQAMAAGWNPESRGKSTVFRISN
jgi:hypothetical protein